MRSREEKDFAKDATIGFLVVSLLVVIGIATYMMKSLKKQNHKLIGKLQIMNSAMNDDKTDIRGLNLLGPDPRGRLAPQTGDDHRKPLGAFRPHYEYSDLVRGPMETTSNIYKSHGRYSKVIHQTPLTTKW